MRLLATFLLMTLGCSAFAAPPDVTINTLTSIVSHVNVQRRLGTHRQIAAVHVGMYPVCEVCASVEIESYDQDGNFCRTNIGTITLNQDGTVRDLPQANIHMTCNSR